MLLGKHSGFGGDRRGSVGTWFALSLVPVLGLLGGAVDYGRAVKLRLELQDTMDAAVLAAADTYRRTASTAQAEQALRNMIEVTMKRNSTLDASKSLTGADEGDSTDPDIPQITFDPIDLETGTVSAAASMSARTFFLSLVGINRLEFSVDSAVRLSGNKLELALVLDITGSMTSVPSGDTRTKLESMKEAARDLLDILVPVGLPEGTVKVSVVPFADHVNVGRTYYNSVVTAATRSNGTPTNDQRTCVRERASTSSSIRYSDKGPSDLFNGYPQTTTEQQCSYVGSGKNRKEVCQTVTVPNTPCATAEVILPLTESKQAALDKINALTANGGTAGHLGTAWGWYTISPNWASVWPAGNQPQPYGTRNLVKTVVIMTDGEYNTKYTGSDSTTQALALCNAMKETVVGEDGRSKPKVEVYTIGFGVGNNQTIRNALINCATSSRHYYFPYNSSEIRAAFRNIGAQLAAGALGARIVTNESTN